LKTRYLIAGILMVSVGCSDTQTPATGDFREVPASMVMTGMSQIMTTAGLRKARLYGDTAYVYDDSGKVNIKGVNLSIFNEQGGDVAKLTSKTGDFNTSTQAMVARGNAVLITLTNPRRQIETEELFYDPQSHRLWSDKKTLMIEGDSRITGDGFTADDKFTNVNIRGARGRVSGSKVVF
jgi:LPS export ABC transporter protein LptC